MKIPLLFVSALGLASAVYAADPVPAISAANILAHTKVLASDEFEGRAPGTPGPDVLSAYQPASAPT